MIIHPTAIIDPAAELADDVEIGPYCLVGPGVKLGAGCKLLGHVALERDVTMGEGCTVHFGAVLGGPPQDNKYAGERTLVQIGRHNIIREYVTIHRSTGEGSATVVGDHNMIMAYCHLGHNVRMGSHIMMANSAGVSGHVVIEDRAVIGGMVGFHQYVRVGTLAMVGGMSKVTQDVPPFMLVDGHPARVVGTNFRGQRRAGMNATVRDAIKQAYRILYRENRNRSEALAMIEEKLGTIAEVRYLLDFMAKPSYAGRQLDPIAEALAKEGEGGE